MGDSNPFDLGGLADDATALTRVLRSLYHHFTITLQSLKQASVSPTITNDSVPQRSPLRPRTTPLFPPVLGDDAVEVLGPCRPAFDIPRVIVTVLVAQHRGLARGIRAGGVPGVVTPRHHMAFQGGLEGRGGVALRQFVVTLANHFEHVKG